MIYLDNAATSRSKPEEAFQAFNYYVREIGTSPGRGSYSLGIEASRMLYKSRKTVADFFGIYDASNVIFTKNSTEAINLFLNGFLKHGDHVLISPYEHNSVLRPLHNLKEKGVIDYTILPEDALYSVSDINQYVKSNTRLAAITLASNLTGQIVFSKELGAIMKSKDIFVFVDASQGAGKKLLNMKVDNIDVLAFTGHKDLLAFPGVGGLCSIIPLKIPPLIQGGTGIYGDSYVNPTVYPEAYESGTLNMPAIWTLKNSLDYINGNSDMILKNESLLMDRLISGLISNPNVIIYNLDKKRVSTICFNIKNKKSNEVVEYLSKNDVCSRGGIHCAILAHQTLGTVETGAIRVSLNHYNSILEINDFLNLMERI